MTALTDYERQRLENIKKNQSLLSSLVIKSVGGSAKKKASGQQRPITTDSSTPSKKRSRPSATTDAPVPLKRHATRASVRLSGVGLSPGELQSHLDKQEEELAAERRIKDALKHSHRPLLIEDWRTGPDSSLTAGLFTSLASSIAPKPTKTMKQEEVNLEYSPGQDQDYDRLASQLNTLQLRALNKPSPTRIYCMTFHPDPRKSLLFVGDKLGGIAIWDAFPTDGHLVYTSSYDGTIREHNVESQQSREVVDSEALNPDEETLFSAFEFANEGREIWASDNAGGRSIATSVFLNPTPVVGRFQEETRLSQYLSQFCRPTGGDCWTQSRDAVGLFRTVLRQSEVNGVANQQRDLEQRDLANYAHGLACSSAYFNPTGNKIVSTSYDDLVDSWLGGQLGHVDLAPAFQARHDNQTGRWISQLSKKPGSSSGLSPNSNSQAQPQQSQRKKEYSTMGMERSGGSEGGGGGGCGEESGMSRVAEEPDDQRRPSCAGPTDEQHGSACGHEL